MAEPKPVVITMVQAYDKYKELNLGNHSYRKKIKPTNEALHTIEQILESFDIKVTKIPEDKAIQNQWKLEWKRIQEAYLRMIKCIQSRKISGIFFNSSNYSVFAQKTEENEADDPTVQVMFGIQKKSR